MHNNGHAQSGVLESNLNRFWFVLLSTLQTGIAKTDSGAGFGEFDFAESNFGFGEFDLQTRTCDAVWQENRPSHAHKWLTSGWILPVTQNQAVITLAPRHISVVSSIICFDSDVDARVRCSILESILCLQV